MNRRQFISKTATMGGVALVAGSGLFSACGTGLNRGRIGIQLYSVKDELPKDFKGTLEKLAAMGYSAIEPYGFNGKKFFELSMKELSVMARSMGMTISSTHTGSGILPEDTSAKEWDFWKECCESLRDGGGKWAVQAGIPGAHETLDDLKRMAEHLNRVGEMCRKFDVKLAFHNHNAEFQTIEGEVFLDYLIKNTDPKLVYFQMDMGHTVNGGGDCLHYLKTYPGRIPLWHASDFDATTRKYTIVGQGSVPYADMFAQADSLGLEVLTVEQETGGDIFAACKADFDWLKQFEWTGV